ncbi:hypothetical protein [Methylobacterium sp. WL6]|uniref:hypothetical protein n=1 Tax=Methylobacterium sp. WL6 TaxID=2603901 RepID=UPI0011CBA3CA|nr:hypothetical protein [Methylobacterium sp. WL6]TXN67271.1 hypothetical protein FV230_14510 [Methylobacterium sp. WL6]
MSQPPVYRDVLDGTEQFRVLLGGRFYVVPVSAITALVAPSVAALSARLAIIEGRPEEVAHFTASAKLPPLTAGQSVMLTLTGLVPAVSGDRIRKGEAVQVASAAALPAGVNIAAAYAAADDTVAVQLTTGLNLAAGTVAVAWNLTALR